MNAIAIILPVPPSVNRRYVVSKSGSIMLTEETRVYMEHVKAICISQDLQALEGDLVVTIDVFAPNKRTDVDNYLKAPLDALQGYAYGNDNQVKRIVVTRYVDKQNPRLEVSVTHFE